MESYREVYSIPELTKKGYPKALLEQLAHSEDFPAIGFTSGKAKKRFYFFKDKLEAYLERRTELWS